MALESKFKISDELFSDVPLQLRGLLKPESKRLMTLPPVDRDKDSILKLISQMEYMEFFQKFSYDTQIKLAENMRFVVCEANEFLLRQGKVPGAMYLIISGVVSLRYRIHTTANFGNMGRWPEKILREGEFFGEIDLLQNRPSSVDAYSVGYTELLEIKAEDFVLVRESFEEKDKRLKLHLRKTESLAKFNWSEEELKVLELFSELRSYLEETEIYNGNDITKSKWSYFVIFGECKLAREVGYFVPESGPRRLKSAKDGAYSGQKIFKKVVEFETGKQGFFFGVGEDFRDNRVLATPALECLLIPRLVLVFKNRELMTKMASDLANSLPSDQVVLDHLLNYEQATKEVEELLKDILALKPTRLINSQISEEKPRFVKYV
ncbi:cyclic nucleotide-binding domain-containing protein [Nephila pilipes]|uniref:Cyclic nucleotide-binding domain-containing protein n=1 Tax=Nephila pilipes TaxID=299642 RepID=A0A8X6NVU8_NEPPI|nr:cyclic nucleotide-binding domain-containing protein [Nephila pilipes]